MENLAQVQKNRVYEIKKIMVDESVKRHLQELGIVVNKKVVLSNFSGENGVILLQNNRIAVSKQILQTIFVEKPSDDPETWTSLDQLAIDDSAHVVSIHGQGAVKRRLMDMGITKNVQLKVKNVAPLGDPIEIVLRGYALSLRKSEASMILVQKEEAQ
ncbi:MAG: ferrous iron transport protein A [Enterococcus sp.]